MDVMFQKGISARKSSKYELTSEEVFLADRSGDRVINQTEKI